MTAVFGLVCLALNVFHESRGEPVKGQYAVALVTMNRVKSETYPDKSCDVVFQKGQFEWVNGSKSPKTILRLRKQAKSKDAEAWSKSVDIAAKVMNRKVKDFTGGALYFNKKNRGRKYRTDVRAKTYGQHIFY